MCPITSHHLFISVGTTLKEKSSDRSCVSKLKTRIFWVVGSSPLEVAPSPWQTGGLHFKLDCSCNWLLLLAKNEAENQPLGNFSGFLFKVLNNTQYQYQFFERRLAIPNTNILKVLTVTIPIFIKHPNITRSDTNSSSNSIAHVWCACILLLF